jgi:hypothetical protein
VTTIELKDVDDFRKILRNNDFPLGRVVVLSDRTFTASWPNFRVQMTVGRNRVLEFAETLLAGNQYVVLVDGTVTHS